MARCARDTATLSAPPTSVVLDMLAAKQGMHLCDLSSLEASVMDPRTTLSCLQCNCNCLQLCEVCMQAEPDKRWQSRIKIRVRGSQLAGNSKGNVGSQSAGDRKEHKVPVVQQEQAATLSSHGLNSESIPSAWQWPDPRRGSQAAGSRSDKTISQLRLPERKSSSAQTNPHNATEALSNGVKTDRLEEGQEAASRSAVGPEDTASATLPADRSAALISGLSDIGSSPRGETPQPEEEAPAQGAASLASAWNAALGQARVPSVFAAISEEPTAAMLQYAAAPAQLPPSRMTCEAWLTQADKRRSVVFCHTLSW